MKSTDNFNSRFELKKLVWTIGYRMTAYLGGTTIPAVAEWLNNGLPNDLDNTRKPLTMFPSPSSDWHLSLSPKAFSTVTLMRFRILMFPSRRPITMLRDAANLLAVRAQLMVRAKKEFLENVASGLEGVERRLKEWI
jgi:hypothetical protein